MGVVRCLRRRSVPVLRRRWLVVATPLVGLALGLLAGARYPTTAVRGHSCQFGAPRSACSYPPVTQHHYWMYALLGLAVGGLVGMYILVRSRRPTSAPEP